MQNHLCGYTWAHSLKLCVTTSFNSSICEKTSEMYYQLCVRMLCWMYSTSQKSLAIYNYANLCAYSHTKVPACCVWKSTCTQAHSSQFLYCASTCTCILATYDFHARTSETYCMCTYVCICVCTSYVCIYMYAVCVCCMAK